MRFEDAVRLAVKTDLLKKQGGLEDKFKRAYERKVSSQAENTNLTATFDVIDTVQ